MSKRDDIKAELDALGVEYNARLGEAKLAVLLEEAKGSNAPAVEEAASDEGGLVIPEGAEIKIKGKEAKVFGPDANYIRTYSEAMHGKEFLKIAQSYANKIGGLVQ